MFSNIKCELNQSSPNAPLWERAGLQNFSVCDSQQPFFFELSNLSFYPPSRRWLVELAEPALTDLEPNQGLPAAQYDC